MIAWINFAILVISTSLCLVFYVKSAGPATLEKKIGPVAYRKCTRYRFISSIFMGIASLNYAVYFFYPLPTSLPQAFPWPWWISAVMAVSLALPGGYLFGRGARDAGEETMVVKKEHTLYGGLYEKMRHPQAAGELLFWWVLSFLLHSPFLALFSLIWIPIFYAMCLAEEKDLTLRYGEAYEAYRNRTGFLLPRLGQ